MDPKDRVETVAKTKAGGREEKASPGDQPAPGADYTVPAAEAEAIVENLAKDIVNQLRPSERGDADAADLARQRSLEAHDRHK